MDFSDYHETWAAFLEALRHTLRAEITSVWLPIQFGLIGLGAVIAFAIAATIRSRTDPDTATMGWPPILRLIVRTLYSHLGAITFILVLLAIRSGVRADIIHFRTYLLGVAINLTTAWVVIDVIAGIIHNRFVN